MTLRISDKTALQGIVKNLLPIGEYLRASSLDPILLELTSMRASQINGCAHCLAMHSKALREAGEREDRLAVLPAWRETDWFSDRERAALAWSETVTTLDHREVPDHVFEMVRAEFSEQELADLTLAVVMTNAANRLSIAFRYPPAPFSINEREAEAAD